MVHSRNAIMIFNAVIFFCSRDGSKLNLGTAALGLLCFSGVALLPSVISVHSIFHQLVYCFMQSESTIGPLFLNAGFSIVE